MQYVNLDAYVCVYIYFIIILFLYFILLFIYFLSQLKFILYI